MLLTPEILIQKRKAKGLSQKEVADAIGVSQASYQYYETGERNPKHDKVQKLLQVLDIGTTNIVKAPKSRIEKRVGYGLVKFYDVDFAAGDVEFYEDSNSILPAYEMDIPEFAGCTAFRTYGDSMEPAIKSGSILFGTRVEDWQSHLEYGQIYGIVCKDKRKYLKYIRKDKDSPKLNFLLRSENKEYDDFELPKDKIKSIWLIHGWINKRN